MVVVCSGVNVPYSQCVVDEWREECECCGGGEDVEGGIVDEFGVARIFGVGFGGVEGLFAIAVVVVVRVPRWGEAGRGNVDGEARKLTTKGRLKGDTPRVAAEGKTCIVAGYILRKQFATLS